MALTVSSDHWNGSKYDYVPAFLVSLPLQEGWEIRATRRVTLDPGRKPYAEDGRAIPLTPHCSPPDCYMRGKYMVNLPLCYLSFICTSNQYNIISLINKTNEWYLLSSDYRSMNILYGLCQLSQQFHLG